MRYPLTHKTRHSVIAAVLLLAVGALAAAAAHASKSGTARGDIALVNPVPDRGATATAPNVRSLAPLFAGGSGGTHGVGISSAPRRKIDGNLPFICLLSVRARPCSSRQARAR